MRLMLLALVVTSSFACQTRAIVVRTMECQRVCPGCCDVTGACLTGEDNDACGAPGAACSACGPSETCSARSCVGRPVDGGVDVTFDGGNQELDAGALPMPDAGTSTPTPCPPDGWCMDGLDAMGQAITTNHLRSVWARASDDVWAVGDQGTVLHFDGVTWRAAQSGISDDLFGVWAAGPNDVWATGGSGNPSQDVGVILHFDGAAWSVVRRGLKRVDAVWGSSASDVWFAGTAGTLLRWNGTMLTAVASNTTRDIVDLTGNGTRAWAVGSSGLILSWNGASWSEVSTGMTSGLTSALAFGASLTWVAGGNGAFATWDGATWRTLSVGQNVTVMGMWGARPDAVWSVGPDGELHFFNGVSPSIKTSPTTRFLRDVHGSDARNIWAVGFNGTVLRYRP